MSQPNTTLPQPCYRLVTVDGDDIPIKLCEFLADNDDDLCGAREPIEALAIGETFYGGGGASPEWSIRRVS